MPESEMELSSRVQDAESCPRMLLRQCAISCSAQTGLARRRKLALSFESNSSCFVTRAFVLCCCVKQIFSRQIAISTCLA